MSRETFKAKRLTGDHDASGGWRRGAHQVRRPTQINARVRPRRTPDAQLGHAHALADNLLGAAGGERRFG